MTAEAKRPSARTVKEAEEIRSQVSSAAAVVRLAISLGLKAATGASGRFPVGQILKSISGPASRNCMLETLSR